MIAAEYPTGALERLSQPTEPPSSTNPGTSVCVIEMEKAGKGRIGIGLQATSQKTLVVSSVVSGMGQAAGLMVGDVLLEINGVDAKSTSDLSKTKANALLFDAKGLLRVSVLRSAAHPAVSPSSLRSGGTKRLREGMSGVGTANPVNTGAGNQGNGAAAGKLALPAAESAAKPLGAEPAATTAPKPALIRSGAEVKQPTAETEQHDEPNPPGEPKASRVSGLKQRLAALANKVGARCFAAQEAVTYKHPTSGELLPATIVQVHDQGAGNIEYTIACGMQSHRVQAYQLRARQPEAELGAGEGGGDAKCSEEEEEEDAGEPPAKVPRDGHRERPSAVPPLELTARGIGGNAKPISSTAAIPKRFGKGW